MYGQYGILYATEVTDWFCNLKPSVLYNVKYAMFVKGIEILYIYCNVLYKYRNKKLSSQVAVEAKFPRQTVLVPYKWTFIAKKTIYR